MKHCKLIRKISQQELNDENDKIKAIRDILNKNDIEDNADKEIDVLLSEKGINKIKDNMGLIFDKQAYILEKLSFLSDSATNKQKKYTKDLNKLGSGLKKCLHECLDTIEKERNKLIVLQEVFKKRIKSEDTNFKSILKEIYAEGDNKAKEAEILDEQSEDSNFMSFEENSQELQNVQNSFFLKKSDLQSDQNFKSFNQSNEEIILNDDIMQVNQTKTEEESKKKEEKVEEETQFDSLRQLMSTNPAFTKYPVRDGPLVRHQMPVFRDPNVKINVWSILKSNIGKDLSKITMPVYVNEPLSMLQKVTEYVEYKECFVRANNCEDRYLRPALVLSAFFITFSNTINRIKKPFNPLLGETYEYMEKDLRVLVEQVSHHPPISSFYVESDDFIMEGYFYIKTSFNHKGFQANPIGDMKIYLKKQNERYSLKRPKSTLHNYIIGKMYLWHSGDMIVTNETTGDKAIMYLKPKGWLSKSDYEGEGKVIDEKGNTQYNLYGKWNSFAKAVNIETGEEIELIKKYPDVENYDQQYYFSKFIIGLNHLTKKMITKLPPTDTRFRTDQRAYEYGDLTLAASEKHRLEEAQRARRREREHNNIQYRPVWFNFEKEGKTVIRNEYKGGYWEAHKTGQWPENITHIFT